MKETTHCSNCKTGRYPIHAKGLCRRCYGIARTISQVEKWNLADLKSLQGYPRSLPLPPSSEYVPKIQAYAIKQLTKRLERLRVKERILDGPADGTHIEYQLQRIAERAGARNAYKITHGLAVVFDDFGPQHRKTLYQVLNSIEEKIPWRGIHWTWYPPD